MRMLSVAAAAITVAIFLAAAGPEEGSALALATQLLALVSGLAFLLGLAPPAPIRTFWRRREQERIRRAVADLMGASTQEQVADVVLPPMAEVLSARAVVLRDENGRMLGSYNHTEGLDETAEDALRIDIPSGSIVLWTSPYAPYFGRDELGLVQSLGALTGLALDRSRLFAQEREARLALERADQLKTNFVALAAHELRTPVAAVHGIVETIERRADVLGEEQRADLQRALYQQTQRLTLLVEQLLDLSRLDADAIAIRPQPLHVRERVQEVVAAAAGDRAGGIEIAVPPELDAVVDPDVFDRILSNLVVNALRYGETPITVSADRSDRHLRVAVEDRGPGVPPEFVPSLFERFTRSDATRERAIGTGLGLAIARSFANAHHGELLYEQAQPRGARFELVLPARSE